MKNMSKLLKQAQQMQAQMAKTQAELSEKEIEATSGGGMVKVVVKGSLDLVALEIDPQVVDPEDIEMLQDLIVAAVNEGLRQARSVMEGEMGKLTGSMKIPGLF